MAFNWKRGDLWRKFFPTRAGRPQHCRPELWVPHRGGARGWGWPWAGGKCSLLGTWWSLRSLPTKPFYNFMALWLYMEMEESCAEIRLVLIIGLHSLHRWEWKQVNKNSRKYILALGSSPTVAQRVNAALASAAKPNIRDRAALQTMAHPYGKAPHPSRKDRTGQAVLSSSPGVGWVVCPGLLLGHPKMRHWAQRHLPPQFPHSRWQHSNSTIGTALAEWRISFVYRNSLLKGSIGFSHP